MKAVVCEWVCGGNTTAGGQRDRRQPSGRVGGIVFCVLVSEGVTGTVRQRDARYQLDLGGGVLSNAATPEIRFDVVGGVIHRPGGEAAIRRGVLQVLRE